MLLIFLQVRAGDLAILETASSPAWTSPAASAWPPRAGAPARNQHEAFCWTHFSSLISILYWRTQNWHGLTKAEQKGMIASLKQLAVFLLTQPRMLLCSRTHFLRAMSGERFIFLCASYPGWTYKHLDISLWLFENICAILSYAAFLSDSIKGRT